jgi:Ca2+-transporting ATPase
MMTKGISAPAPWIRDEAWHSLDRQSVLSGLQASEAGFDSAEAARRLAAAGPNILPRKPPPPAWLIVLRQFKSPLIYVLAASAAVSLALGHVEDAGFIGFVLFANALIGSVQEWKAEKSTQALQKLLQIKANAMRDGELAGMEAEAVVPGDILWIESGERVPADIRLLDVTGLEIDESLITGESLAVAKDAHWSGPRETPLGDRLDMAFAGSTVQRGRGRGVAVATGSRTEIGRLASDLLFAPETPPPLVQRMERFSFWLAIALSVMCVLVGGVGTLLQARPLSEMFFFVVALAVSAIPEGLPAALAVALSVAMSRMSRRGVIVRRLPAVEGLGSCTLIASDKTGTLTCNELTVKEIRLPGGDTIKIGGEGFAPEGEAESSGAADARLEALAGAAALCNEGDLRRAGDGWSWRGDPTDVALLSMAHKLGWRREALLETHPLINSIPFEPERRFAASFHRVNGDVTVFVKGAPERVLGMCSEGAGGQAAVAEDLAARGFRVLAFAVGRGPKNLRPEDAPPEPAGLAFLGFTGMVDPLRPGAREAVAACQSAGVDVWMVTGDHPLTALAIARDLGLAQRRDQVVTGGELQGMGPEALARTVETAKVFARVAPDQKLRLVQAAKAAGHFVAVTGDGVNDAPALKAAHIGVAMGRDGTDVAREAAEIVLSDDNFSSVVAGIEEGRIAYKNIRNVIAMQISTAAAEVLICGLGVFLDMPLLLLPVQLLWLNLVTNGIQDVALAFEPGEGNELRRRPRPPAEPIFNRVMLERVAITGGVMSLLGFGLFRWMLGHGVAQAEARNVLLLFMVLFENVQVGNCRSESLSVFKLSPFRSPLLLAGTLAALGLHVAAMYLPVTQRLLGMAPVSLKTWILLAPPVLVVVAASEIHKVFIRRREAGAEIHRTA